MSETPRTALMLAAVWSALATATAQELPPGYVDPLPVLEAAAEAIGSDALECVQFSGAGYAGIVGQAVRQSQDWPRRPFTDYTRTIDYRTGTSVETFTREPGENPGAWKYGVGWLGGTRKGYTMEVVAENYVLSDDVRNLHISYVQPLDHVEGMLMAYLPKEKIAIEADLTDAAASPSSRQAFYDHVERLGLDVETIVRIHGRPSSWTDFTDGLGQ